MKRPFNFSSGPAVLPEAVLERARDEMMSLGGLSVMEISHRSAEFGRILDGARDGLRELLAVPSDYEILFLQGGATLQFSMVPMNLLGVGHTAQYILTGTWGKKAAAEATKFGNVAIAHTSEVSGFKTIPRPGEVSIDPDAAYVHYTSNETIDGVEFGYDLDGEGLPVICDASSNILSKPIDLSRYSLIYAGAQKNIGPSGVTVVIIRRELLERSPDQIPATLNYRAIAENGSMLNTPNTWGIYMIGLVCDWLKAQGGLAEMETRNKAKAAALYDAVDSSDGYYRGHAEHHARSRMNITFRLAEPDLDEKFAAEAEAAGFHGVKGHRSVGGIRASIYNAFPREGVERFVEFMKDFAARS